VQTADQYWEFLLSSEKSLLAAIRWGSQGACIN
jgi:hypothetical protein